MTNLADKIKKTIKEKNIRPRAKWYFIVWQIILWTLIVSGIIFLGLALSLNWEILIQHDVPLMMKRRLRGVVSLLKAVPYFWVVISLILSALIYFEFQRTKKGYKINFIYIVGIISGSSLLLSGVFYGLGISENIEHRLEKQRPYHAVVPVPKNMWLKPEDGMLWGDILKIEKENIKLRDINEQEWLIIISDDTAINKNVILKEGEIIRTLGEIEDDFIFEASFIKPWQRQGKGKKLFSPLHEIK